MAANNSFKQITLNGTGTEIPALNITDSYEYYEIKGSVITTGNYAINPTGSPQVGTTFEFDFNGVIDITTNGNTFAIFGVQLTQTQLLTKLTVICRYDGSAWKVRVLGSLDQSIITATNLGSNSVTTVKIANEAVTNAKTAQMANNTVKANISGGLSIPSDVPVSSLVSIAAWSILGNNNLNSSVNFLGTTDSVDLVFKANNQEAGRIDLTLNNTSFGDRALSTINRTGDLNTAIGTQALQANDTGYNNTAIGHYSLYNNVSGFQNTAIGKSSLLNTSGTLNTGIGENVGIGLTDGDFNTIIGASANVTSGSSQNRIAIGYGASASSNFQFALPDNVTSIKWRGLTYTLPSVQAAGVLTNDGAGNLTWA